MRSHPQLSRFSPHKQLALVPAELALAHGTDARTLEQHLPVAEHVAEYRTRQCRKLSFAEQAADLTGVVQQANHQFIT